MFGWFRAREREIAARALLIRCEEQLQEMRGERDYWREKAEILLDSTLFHRGEVRNHVFSKPKEQSEDPITKALSGLSRHTIESAKRPASARD